MKLKSKSNAHLCALNDLTISSIFEKLTSLFSSPPACFPCSTQYAVMYQQASISHHSHNAVVMGTTTMAMAAALGRMIGNVVS